jgi:hypothetical protein
MTRYTEGMNQIICHIIGHREYNEEVLDVRPWEDPDFASYAQEDFREEACLRCGAPTAHAA